MIELTITDNPEKRRFETIVEGKTAIIEYIIAPTKIFLTHTEVPKALEGKGIASTMIEKVLQTIEERKMKLAPLCPFVAAYLVKHPEWKRLLADGYEV